MSSKRLSIYRRGLRYFLAVAIGFAADVAVFWMLSSVGVPILPANAAGFIIGFTINVMMIRYLAFPGTDVPSHLDYFVTFAVSVAVMFLGSLLIWTLVTRFGLSLISAKVFANGCTLVINFAYRSLLDRHWICFRIFLKRR